MSAPESETMTKRLRTDYRWTRRQREVLDRLARGRSNSDIAEEFGLSLAGVKWHVAEILSKLNADSREEAADYWRRYNGFAPRFPRVFRAIGGSGALLALGSAGVLAVAFAVAVAFFVARGGDGAPTEPPAAPAPIVAEDRSDPSFVLRIEGSRDTWSPDEVIDVTATLAYIGPDDAQPYWTSGMGPLAFDLEEVHGTRLMYGAQTSDCAPHTIAAASPFALPYQKGGGWSQGDPNQAFYEAFFASPELRLPPGDWDFTVRASLFLPPGCGEGRYVQLAATIRITVE